jgi:hypothetical protein
MDIKLTDLEAFYAMRKFLEGHYERTNSDDVGALLSDLQFFDKERETADPAAWEDWMDAISAVIKDRGKKFERDKLYKVLDENIMA